MNKILLLMMLMLPGLALAAEEAYRFDDPEKRAMFQRLTEELRCPMCQNQNIADSDAMIAVDLRRKVYQLVKSGKSEEEVMVFMKQRYGDFVSYQPPITPVTMWMWVLPILFVAAAIGFVVHLRRSQSTEFDRSTLAQADKILEKDE